MFHPERKTHLLQPGANYTTPKKTNMEPETCSPCKGHEKHLQNSLQFWKFHLGFGQLSHSSAKLVAQKVITSEQKKQHDTSLPPYQKKPCHRCHGTIGNLYNRYTGIHCFD